MRVLFISIAFPPKNDPEALQTGKYLKYLAEHVDVDVLTSKSPTLWMPTDDNLTFPLEKIKQKIEIKIFEPKYISILINKFFKRFARPDTRQFFHFQSKKVIKILKVKPNVIYARSFPISSAIMAYKISNYYKVPLILHFSDPWVESPLFNYNKSNYHQKMERKCFNLADIISFTSEQTIQIYKEKYPEYSEKFHYFPNVYDLSSKNEAKNINFSKKTRIVYTGSLSRTRNFSPIINALKTVINSNPKLHENIEIIVAGSADNYNKKLLEQFPLIINYKGFISHSEAKQLQNTADLLIAIDHQFENAKDGLFFPSKLLDYFITKKLILGITTKNSSTDSVLKKTTHHVIYHNEIAKLVLFLENIEKIKGESVDIPEFYSAKSNVARLVKLFESLC